MSGGGLFDVSGNRMEQEMRKKQKLELTWIGKDVRPKLEPRILLENPELSFHAETRVTDKDIFDNLLIHGDNLLALKALEQEYAGKVKCIYIDPPYNTGSAFEHYDDGVEHSLWLSLMRDRVDLLRRLLSDDGSLWVNLDNHEAHYFKVMCDEVFARENFVNDITWQKKYSVSNNFKGIASICDHIIVYSKSSKFQNNLLPRTEESTARYTNPDNDPRGPWKAVDYLNQATPEKRPNLCYDIRNPTTGRIIKNSKKAWKYDPKTHELHVEEKRLWWGINGTNTTPALKLFLAEVRDGMTPHNWWAYDEVGHTDEAKKEMIALFGARNVFDTPKPERLIQRILHIATNPGDLVLDSFLGSGTTAAVAHKMGRRWIGIELGEHCYTHCVPRLQKVIKGEDPGGITFTPKSKAIVTLCKNCQDSLCEECQEKVGKNARSKQVWFGGGGFRFYELGPSLIREDAWGNPVINPEFNPEMLAEALCKLENFTYSPSPETFWIHGQSSEADFIYVTTRFLTQDMLTHIAVELGEKRSLLICCGAHSVDANAFPNITIKKIPKAVLEKCEWGKDDYSLAVENLPQAEPVQAAPPAAPAKGSKKSAPSGQISLFEPSRGEK